MLPRFGSDSRRFPRLLVGTLVLLALGALYGSFLMDAPVRRMVLEANGGHWSHNPLVAMCSRYGDWPELMLVGALSLFAARALRNVRWQRILLSAMIASTLAGMVVNASRLTTGRTRPRAEAAQGWYGPRHDGKWLIGEADFNSFPSGHTATAVGFAGVILFASPAWGMPAMLAALSIILSRLLLGAHHPSDVVAASMIALGIAWLVWEFFGRRGRIDGAVRADQRKT
jgi:membrane-associated phospholipid phosphatase